MLRIPSVCLFVAASGLLIIALPASALAYCAQPSMYRTPPSPPSYGRPNVPYCLSGFAFSGKHSCERYQIDSYISEVDRYIDELNDYVAEANDFAISADRFAEEALAFARCEAEDIRRQHK